MQRQSALSRGQFNGVIGCFRIKTHGTDDAANLHELAVFLAALQFLERYGFRLGQFPFPQNANALRGNHRRKCARARYAFDFHQLARSQRGIVRETIHKKIDAGSFILNEAERMGRHPVVEVSDHAAQPNRILKVGLLAGKTPDSFNRAQHFQRGGVRRPQRAQGGKEQNQQYRLPCRRKCSNGSRLIGDEFQELKAQQCLSTQGVTMFKKYQPRRDCARRAAVTYHANPAQVTFGIETPLSPIGDTSSLLIPASQTEPIGFIFRLKIWKAPVCTWLDY
ncbi:MAG: hypothetical protein EPO07_15910 [Verrucomicrobia bacterium]|nr:MAG: hypothetical protein EPO07_15910 [Verrucomicrobiota bacterium]